MRRTTSLPNAESLQKDGGEEDASWSRLGVAWVHRDGKGFDVVLDALPINGRVVLRLNKAKPPPS
jgi:hypothetical protein